MRTFFNLVPRALVAAIAALLVVMTSAFAASPEIYTSRSKLALEGYDAVAYFTDGKPVRGNSEITYEWKGATWRFSSEANRDKFKENPEAFAPQYGGYCAYAVSQGATAPADPTAWKIVDGKLYVNFDASVHRNWERKSPRYISQANKNWPRVLGK